MIEQDQELRNFINEIEELLTERNNEIKELKKQNKTMKKQIEILEQTNQTLFLNTHQKEME